MNTYTCFCCYLLLFVVICCYLLLFDAIWCYLMFFVVIHNLYLFLFVTDCCHSPSVFVAMYYYLLLFPNNVSYNVLHKLRQCQPDALHVWDRPDACFAWCFTRSQAMSGQRTAAPVGSPRWMPCIRFCTHWGNAMPRDCLCAIAQIHALYCALHALR